MHSYNPTTQENKKISGLRSVGNKIKNKTNEVNKAGRACTFGVYLPIQATHGTLHSPVLMDGTRGPYSLLEIVSRVGEEGFDPC